MRGGLLLAGVLLLVTLLAPVEEDTEGAVWAVDKDIEAGIARSPMARCLVEPVDLRFSLESLVWLVLARGVERRVAEEEGRLKGLLGVL
jgi:hypothetical protein